MEAVWHCVRNQVSYFMKHNYNNTRRAKNVKPHLFHSNCVKTINVHEKQCFHCYFDMFMNGSMQSSKFFYIFIMLNIYGTPAVPE